MGAEDTRNNCVHISERMMMSRVGAMVITKGIGDTKSASIVADHTSGAFSGNIIRLTPFKSVW